MSKYLANYLFVYGYLMRKNRIIKELGVPEMPAIYIGEGYVYGNLYRVGGFPGLVYDQKQKKRVYGELYLLKKKNDFFKEMDDYELSYPNYHGEDAAYHRRVRPVHLNKDKVYSCWMYEYILPTGHLEHIKSGRFNLLP